MAIGYIKRERLLNHNGEVRRCYVAKVAYGSYVDEERLAEEIAKISTASEGDVLLVLRAMEQRISFHLSQGDVVKMDTLGAFYPTIHATAVPTAGEVKASTVQRTGVLFRPAKRLAEAVRGAGVRLVDTEVHPADNHSRPLQAE